MPTPAALVTYLLPNGQPSIVTLGEVSMLALDPLVVGISIRPARYSHPCISAAREYVVNFPTAELTAALDICGTTSGRDTDKFVAAGLTPEPAEVVRTPLIRECPISIECRLRDVLPMASHDLFVGEAVATHVEDWALDAAGFLDPVRARSVAFVGRGYWRVGELADRAFVRRPLARGRQGADGSEATGEH